MLFGAIQQIQENTESAWKRYPGRKKKKNEPVKTYIK
jgi:hypothetical protein